MKLSLAGGSLFLFGLSVVLWVMLTLFESSLVGMSFQTEKVVTFLLLVVPTGIGAILGVTSLARREERTLMAVTGIVLNTLFAIFHLVVILFSG